MSDTRDLSNFLKEWVGDDPDAQEALSRAMQFRPQLPIPVVDKVIDSMTTIAEPGTFDFLKGEKK